jgi:uncharacterized protein (TIGR03437 family)
MRLFLACIALSVAAQAATINTTLTVTNATVSFGLSTTVTGPATLTNIGSGTFTATISTSGDSFSGPFTITLSNGTDKITGTLTIPATLLGGTGTGSAQVTGGAGAYLNASGSFPSLNGTGNAVGTSITLTLTGAGSIVTGGPPTPTISAVLDAASYTTTIAQGSIFVVKGTNMSADGFVQTSFPLPTNSGSVKITFVATSGGAGTDAFLIYLYNQGGVNQLAAIVPSSLNPGTYNMTVTNNNGVTSPPFAVTIVLRKPGIITQDSTGNGLAVVQNFVSATNLVVNRYTTGSVGGVAIGPAAPGQTEILWVVGMGKATGADNTASPGFDFTQNGVSVQVVIGGTVTINPFYAGRAPGLAGVDQVNFTLPSNVPTGCTVQVQLVVNGVKSLATTFMAIKTDAGANACVQPGFTTAQLQAFDQGATITTGGFTMIQFSQTIQSLGTVKLDTASGVFTQYSGFQLASIPPQSSTSVLPIGNCIVTQPSTAAGAGLIPAGGINLDAGNVTLTGPSGSNLNNTAFTETNNVYSLNIGIEGSSVPLPGFGNGSIVAGTYSLHGAGGTGVKVFDASVSLGTPLTITGGLPTAIVRASGIPLAWTGGNPNDLVEIFGSTSQTSGSSGTTISFVCFTTAGQGGFTVPSSVTNQMFAVPASGGFVGVASGTFPSAGNGLFNFTLVSDSTSHQGTFTALVGSGTSAAYQ